MPSLGPEVVLGLLALAPALGIAAYPLCAARLLRRRPALEDGMRPPWTVLVPVRGADADLDANLRRALAQEAPPGTAWRFCVESEDDAGAGVARRAIARAAPVDARLVIAGPPGEALAKVHNLVAGIREARGEIIVLLDADAWLPHTRFLLELTAPLAAAGAGLVTAYPWYVGARNPGAGLLAAMVNADLLGMFALRSAFDGRRFANGTCLALRRDALDAAGGLEQFGRRMLMDTALAAAVAATGRPVSLHPEPVRVRRVRISIREVLQQAHRWHASLRRGLHPASYAAFGWLRAAFPLALLAWLCAPGRPWAIALVAAVAGTRLASSAALAAQAGVARASGPMLLWQLPADVLAPLVWLRGAWDDRVSWQDRHYRLRPGARLEPASAPRGPRLYRVRAALSFVRVGDWGVQLVILAWVGIAMALAANVSPASYAPALGRAILAQALLLLGGYAFNDLRDHAQDAFKRGEAPARSALAAKRLIVPLALTAGVAIAWSGGPAARAIVLAQLVGGLAYSAPPARLKERGGLGVIAAALLQRLPGAALIAVAHPPAPAIALLGATWLSAVGARFILEHQLEDFDSDARAGVRTWARDVGRPRARRARDLADRAAFVLTLTGVATLAAIGTGPGALGAAAAWLALDRGGATLLTRRYRADRRPPTRPTHRPRECVRIYGAGLAGLTAAARLAEWGLEVQVHEQRLRPGGMAESAPAVHSLEVEPGALEDALGLPIADLFEPIAREQVRLAERIFDVEPRHVNVERGARRGAIDQRLLELVRERGVEVRFASPLRPGDAAGHPNLIVATGLGRVLERAFAIDTEPVDGWVASGPHHGRATLTTFRRRAYGSGYGYVASRGDVRSALLFARGVLPAEARLTFQRDLEHDLGWRPESWTRLRGVVPRTPRLERDGVVLAGTAAGLVDPFYLSGVEGALVSGVLAAWAVVDRDAAQRAFWRLTRGFALKRLLASRAWSPTAPAAETFAAALLNHALGRVGRAA